VNIVSLVGNLTKDAELKYTQGGYAVANFTLAENYNIKRGEKWEQESNFFVCTLFGKRAEGLNQYLTKGQKVAVIGKLRQERWEKDGKQQSRVIILIEELELVGAKPEYKERPKEPGPYQKAWNERKDVGRPDPVEPEFMDDIPPF
jgi:single-strand DNA-binding protein